jgi:hypothetical protein
VAKLAVMNARIPLTALATTAALALVACGGSSDSGLSKTDLAKKADSICKTASDAAGKLSAPADFGQPNSNAAAAASYLGKLAPITKQESDDLAALKPADAAKTGWGAFVAKEKQLSRFLDGVLAKAKAKAQDASGIDDLAKVPQLGSEFTAAATKVGATGCAKG